MKRLTRTLGLVLWIPILLYIGPLFYRELARNFAEITSTEYGFDFGALGISVALAIIAYLGVTDAWRRTINNVFVRRRLAFLHGIPAVNLPGLAKYVPGKVWSYALQIVWLKKLGYSTSAVLNANAVNVLSTVLVSGWFGLGLLMFFHPAVLESLRLSKPVAAALLLAVIAASAVFIFSNKIAVSTAMQVLRHLSAKRSASSDEIEANGSNAIFLLGLQMYFIAIYVLFACSGIFAAESVGITIGTEHWLLFLAATALADTIGFLAILVPGGLGVREGILLLLLKQVINDPRLLLVPIATRVAIMIAEAILALVSSLLVKRLTRQITSSETAN